MRQNSAKRFYLVVIGILAATVVVLVVEQYVSVPDRPAVTPTDSRVYDLHLLAKQRIYERTRPMLESAAKLLDEAIALDPDYAPAYAQRGITELLLVDGNHGAKTLNQALLRSKQYMDRSIELDTALAEGWAGLGLYHLTRQNENQQAIEALRKAVAIEPDLTDALNWLRNALNSSGDVGAARAITELMVRQDPLYRPGFTGAVITFNRFGEHDKAFALIDQVKTVLYDDPLVLAAEGITHLYMGNVGTAYPLVESALERIPDNAETRFFFGWALIGTGQFARLAVDGESGQKIAALDRLQRDARAARLAQRMAADGVILPLLQHYNRNAQSHLLIAFVDQRWPDLDAFEAAYPRDVFGHEEMAELAYAYRRNADPRFQAALLRVGRAIDKLAALGVDNWVFERNRAVYFALSSDSERALAALSTAIDNGYRDILPLGVARPAFQSMSSDPRFELLELHMRNLAEGDRALLGLPN